ncbi:MAG: cobyrinate a,c-diamide synthase [Eubacteriales bacterium]|nr:cobyrinate a,c-diamide synthase [Eubacteriales bacterium]
MNDEMARVLVAAPASGSGKTMITCGLLALLKRRKLHIASMKCGPDYIDPMFHRKVLGVPSGNLDSFFTDREVLCSLLREKAQSADITVLEGVMGYYDGLGGASDKASAYEIAKWTQTPTVLVVDCKGTGLSIAATIRGFLEFRPDNGICGVILNRISPTYFDRLKMVIEKECKIAVLGYVPVLKEMEIPSRHLGLHAPDELPAFSAWIDRLADAMEQTIDLNRLLQIARTASILCSDTFGIEQYQIKTPVRVAVARDKAFSFYYEENESLLRRMGAELIYFSPLCDAEIPKEADGIILGGGYPERYARELSENSLMRASVANACKEEMPCIAECGGFMYLQQSLEAECGKTYPMCGVLGGTSYRTERLKRFGYVEAAAWKAGGMLGNECTLKGHEFHYWDCTENGSDFVAHKPAMPDVTYPCMVHKKTMFAGFLHVYYYSNPEAMYQFLKACEKYHNNKIS